MFGLDPASGLPDQERRRTIYTEESLARLEVIAKHCGETGEPFRILLEARRLDGSALHLEAYGALTRDDSGRPAQLHGVVLDRTEERNAAVALQASEAQFASAFEYAVIGKGLVSPDGRWLKINRAMCEMLGYTEAEMLRTTFQEITHPDDLEADLEFVRELLANERDTYQVEKRYLHRSGRIVWALLSVSLVRDAAGQPLNFVSQVQDITNRKQAEAERERLFDLSLDLLCVSGLDGYLRQVNPAWTRVLGWSPEELLRRPVLEFLHPDDLDATEAGRVGLMIGQAVQDLENRYLCKDGSYRWLSWRSFSLPEGGAFLPSPATSPSENSRRPRSARLPIVCCSRPRWRGSESGIGMSRKIWSFGTTRCVGSTGARPTNPSADSRTGSEACPRRISAGCARSGNTPWRVKRNGKRSFASCGPTAPCATSRRTP